MKTALFFELVQLAVGTRNALSHTPTEDEWIQLFAMAKRQTLAGVLFPAVEKVQKENRDSSGLPRWVMLQWLSFQLQCENSNALLNQRAKELTERFREEGRRSCILKGQGVAQLYPRPELRQPGDIDIWVEGRRDDTLTWISERWPMGYPVYHHVDVCIFRDVPVEVHFIPTWLYCPWHNSRLQRFFVKQANRQFSHATNNGFCIPTIPFNLVFSLVHIYHHFFDEGVGLRQLMDYYYIVTSATEAEKEEALEVMHHVGIFPFATAVEYVLEEVFGLSASFALCYPNVKRGQFLLKEIFETGNFGQYDTRTKREVQENMFTRTLRKGRRQIRFIYAYTEEVLSIPFWKVWHYIWRRYKGYIPCLT